MILPEPNYDGYRYYAALYGVAIDSISFRDGTHDYDWKHLREYLTTAMPSCLILTNPHPFTGLCLPLEEITELVRLCRQHGHLAVIDEAYVPFNGFSHHHLIKSFDNLIVLRSFSKSFGIAGLRFGVTMSSAVLSDYLRKWRTAFTVSEPTFGVVKALLKKSAYLQTVRTELIRNRDTMIEWLRELFPEFLVLDSQANFITVDARRANEASRIRDFLKTDGILIKDLDAAVGMTACFRFTVADDPLMQRLLKLFRRYRDFRHDKINHI